jgi:hypothetical protein
MFADAGDINRDARNTAIGRWAIVGSLMPVSHISYFSTPVRSARRCGLISASAYVAECRRLGQVAETSSVMERPP